MNASTNIPPSDSRPVVTDGLSKTYESLFGGRKVVALDSLSLSVEKGEIFGLLGPNGAGKTTLLKLLLGIVQPSSGSARLFGRSINLPIARAGLGFLPENHRFPPFLTASQTLLVYGRLANLDTVDIRLRAPELLTKVGLSEWADARIKEFSKGMTQRLGIAQALLNEPDLLFLDEPTDGVDPIGRRKIRDLLESLKADGMTIFLNSHLLSEVEMVCTRIGILHRGRLVHYGSVQELTRTAGIYRIYVAPGDAAIVAESFPSITISPSDSAEAGSFVTIDAQNVEELNNWIDRFREYRVRILSIVPDQASLETRFIEIIAELDGDSANIPRFTDSSASSGSSDSLPAEDHKEGVA